VRTVECREATCFEVSAGAFVTVAKVECESFEETLGIGGVGGSDGAILMSLLMIDDDCWTTEMEELLASMEVLIADMAELLMGLEEFDQGAPGELIGCTTGAVPLPADGLIGVVPDPAFLQVPVHFW
jgi:hypothetical protein